MIADLSDLRPGDIMFGPIGGLVPGLFPVGAGQAMLGEVFRVGGMSVRHVGIVVEASRRFDGPTVRLEDGSYRMSDPLIDYPDGPGYFRYGVQTAPRLVQAMPRGAEIIDMHEDLHWTRRHAYARLAEDWPGQAADAAAIARLMVTEGVAYSWASYAALAAWKWGLKAQRLESWIGRRGDPMPYPGTYRHGPGAVGMTSLPLEAICSVLVDQAWTLAGKKVMEGAAHQAVTPGALAGRLLTTEGTTWGWPR